MARKKKETETVTDTNETATALSEPVLAIPVEAASAETPVAVAVPVEAVPAETSAPAEVQPQPAPQNGTPANNGPRKPEVSYRCFSDKTTSIEVSVWANRMQGQNGEYWTQYSITVQRSYKDGNGVWCKGGSYRAHDVPVLLFLVQKAYNWCLSARTEDTSIPF